MEGGFQVQVHYWRTTLRVDEFVSWSDVCMLVQSMFHDWIFRVRCEIHLSWYIHVCWLR